MNGLRDLRKNNKIKRNRVDNQDSINSYVNSVNEGFRLSPSYKKINKNFNYTKAYESWIVEYGKPANGVLKKKIIMKPYESLNTGDYVHFNNQTWICILADNIDSFNQKGEIQKCEDNLRFVTNDNGNTKINEFPCVMSSKTLYSDGLEERPQLRYKDDLFGIVVQSNKATSNLKENMSLIFKDEFGVYSKIYITLINRSIKGILTITGKSVQISENDDLDLCIADYKKKDNTPQGNQESKEDTPKVEEKKNYKIKGAETITIVCASRFTIVDEKDNKAEDKWIFTVDKDIVEMKIIDNATVELKVKSTGNIVLSATNGSETIIKNIKCKMRR